eukprot:scaffold14097_cov107-Isochrysis_galbana.AAC.1
MRGGGSAAEGGGRGGDWRRRGGAWSGQGACFFKGLGVEFDGGVGVKHTRAAARALLAAWRG